jgi:hypothetical protein
MGVRSSIKQILRRFGYALVPLAENDGVFDSDGLITIHNHDFLSDPEFKRAYQRGVAAAGDYRWYWRVHVGLWAAATAARLEGDFVECGVNRGFLSSAIMEYLDWAQTGKTFYLLDTFGGLDEQQVGDASEKLRNEKHLDQGFYVTDLESVKANFAEWSNVRIIQGAVPRTLQQIEAAAIAYLHLDMNAAAPEVAAFEMLWEKLSPGAIVLLDDYAFYGYGKQKAAMDAAAARKGVKIASLPTGQGLIIKT